MADIAATVPVFPSLSSGRRRMKRSGHPPGGWNGRHLATGPETVRDCTRLPAMPGCGVSWTRPFRSCSGVSVSHGATPEVETLPAVTAVSLHGTVRSLASVGWQMRIPLEGGHLMSRDLVHHSMSKMSVAPCGVYDRFDGRLAQDESSDPGPRRRASRWLPTAVGQAVFTQVRATGWSVDGHTAECCEGQYCVRAEHMPPPTRDNS